VEAEVRHLRDGDDVDAEVKGDDRNDLVAVELCPPASTASMRSPSPSKATPRSKLAAHDVSRGGQVGRAAADVDVRAVRSVSYVTTCAPSRSNSRGPTSNIAPFAQSTAT
jgi:hypothetical protein